MQEMTRRIKQKDPLFQKFQTLFFEYYKQGFLFSNFISNGGISISSKEELKGLILEDFKDYFEDYHEEHFAKLSSDKREEKLSLSEIISERPSKMKEGALKERRLTKCPECGKQIYTRDIEAEKIDLSKISNFPFSYIHVHSHDGKGPHALLMYFDANLTVRGRKVPKFTNLNRLK